MWIVNKFWSGYYEESFKLKPRQLRPLGLVQALVYVFVHAAALAAGLFPRPSFICDVVNFNCILDALE